MHERVKQFSKQAGNYADLKSGAEGEFYPHYTQKFTDLIVNEVSVSYTHLTLPTIYSV